jgi:hypothetical protein
MSNIAGKAYAMNIVTPMHPSRTWMQRLIFMFSRCMPSTLGGLMGLKLIHFARWVIIRRDQWPNLGQDKQQLRNDYMLFCSNFNGTWDQYIDAFSDGIPDGLDMFWYASTKYPHSIPISAFKDYIAHNQIDTNYYYSATPGSAQRDIKRALRLAAAIRRLEQAHAKGDAAGFATAYRQELTGTGEKPGVQNCLGSPGVAPAASVATQDADVNRRNYIAALSGSSTS